MDLLTVINHAATGIITLAAVKVVTELARASARIEALEREHAGTTDRLQNIEDELRTISSRLAEIAAFDRGRNARQDQA